LPHELIENLRGNRGQRRVRGQALSFSGRHRLSSCYASHTEFLTLSVYRAVFFCVLLWLFFSVLLWPCVFLCSSAAQAQRASVNLIDSPIFRNAS
jgi:hypothetical protein